MKKLLSFYFFILIATPFIFYGLSMYNNSIDHALRVREYGTDERMYCVPVFEFAALILIMLSFPFIFWVYSLRSKDKDSTSYKAHAIAIGVFPVSFYIMLLGFVCWKAIVLSLEYFFS